MGSELVLANARIVTDDSVVAGALVVRDGRIAEVIEGGRVGTDDWLATGCCRAWSSCTPTISSDCSARARVYAGLRMRPC